MLPESFDSISVFMSYITGFAEFVDRSQPLIVVNFFNEIFTQFDAILSGFNVYKVETIGDSYMVSKRTRQYEKLNWLAHIDSK